MNRTVHYLLITLFAAGLFTGPLKAQLPHLIFHAELNGQEQIPAVNTDGRGLITIMYSPDRAKVTVTGLMVDIQGDITAVDLHIGKTGEEGAFLVSLMPTVHGKRLYGVVDVPLALLQNLLPDRAYATVSTTAHPTGEIRGQFICETDLEFGCMMTGNETVPATASTAVAFGGFHFPTGSEDLVYAFVVQGLSSPVTSVGVYEAPAGQNGSLVYTMTNPAGGFIQGLAYLDDLPPNFLRNAREGKYYVIIKTEAFPDGEIRGQLNFLGYFASFAPVNGPQQVPPGPSPGFAFSHNVLNQTLDSLTTTLYVRGITPTSVDVRMSPPGVVGPVLETLTPTATPGLYRKTYALGPDRLTDLAQGNLYINIPTAGHPNGEIRGQLKNSLRKGYAFDLCGEQVVPPTASQGFGVGMASVDQANCYLNYKVIFDHLSGPPTEAFICQAFPTMNGNAIYPMPNTKPIIPGIQEIMASHGVAIEMGETYVLLVTGDYPNGEIRGQIVRGFSCPEESGVSIANNVSEVTVSPVPFNDVINVAFDSQAPFEGRLVLYDILGVPTLTYPVDIVAGNQVYSIPTNSLPKGFYSLILETPGHGAGMLLKKLVREE